MFQVSFDVTEISNMTAFNPDVSENSIMQKWLYCIAIPETLSISAKNNIWQAS